MEVHWSRGSNGIGWKPAGIKVIPPRFYGYPYDGSLPHDEDRLMLDPSGGYSG